jgi:hypothetical protein
MALLQRHMTLSSVHSFVVFITHRTLRILVTHVSLYLPVFKRVLRNFYFTFLNSTLEDDALT